MKFVFTNKKKLILVVSILIVCFAIYLFVSKLRIKGITNQFQPEQNFGSVRSKVRQSKIDTTNVEIKKFELVSTTTTKKAYNYLLSKQDTKGSWGSYVNTVAVLDAFFAINATSTAAEKGISWLDYSITDNSDFFALKIKLQARAGEPTDSANILVGYIDADSGGFGYDSDYEPDPATTADVLTALTESRYEDEGSNTDGTISEIIYYLSENQRAEGGWSSVMGGESDVLATFKVIDALLPYKNRKLKSLSNKEINVDQILDKSISWLKNLQLENGTWSNSLVDSALAVYILKKSGVTPIDDISAVVYLKKAQANDGSFGNGNIFLTALVLKALSYQ
jgi:squalene cyclase